MGAVVDADPWDSSAQRCGVLPRRPERSEGHVGSNGLVGRRKLREELSSSSVPTSNRLGKPVERVALAPTHAVALQVAKGEIELRTQNARASGAAIQPRCLRPIATNSSSFVKTDSKIRLSFGITRSRGSPEPARSALQITANTVSITQPNRKVARRSFVTSLGGETIPTHCLTRTCSSSTAEVEACSYVELARV